MTDMYVNQFISHVIQHFHFISFTDSQLGINNIYQGSGNISYKIAFLIHPFSTL